GSPHLLRSRHPCPRGRPRNLVAQRPERNHQQYSRRCFRPHRRRQLLRQSHPLPGCQECSRQHRSHRHASKMIRIARCNASVFKAAVFNGTVFKVIVAAFLALAAANVSAAQAQKAAWQQVAVPTTASFRGLSVVDEKIVWASGTDGTVVRTLDSGVTWKVYKV